MISLKYITWSLIALAILATAVQAQNTYIPYELGGDNYYLMYGGPNLSASISGTDEFQRGDTVTLYLDLTNYGRILGFKDDKTPQNPKEYALKNAELQDEYKKTTALGITATLTSDTSQIEVKSGDQVVGALRAGEKIQSPLKFTIKIADHTPSGRYPLNLKLSYDYQGNVRVYASDLSTSGGSPTLVNFQESLDYAKANQTVKVPIYIKSQADFELSNATGVISAGDKKSPIQVTYMNTGDQPVKDAVARLSIFKPFSSTDDQAYIGALNPGESKTVVFRIDVDSDATPKDYGINSEIKYTDINGDTIISESMKIPVIVKAAHGSMIIPGTVLLVLVLAVGVYAYRRKQKPA